MKRIYLFILTVAIILSSFVCVPSYASSEMYDDSYYRFNDFCDLVSEEEYKALNSLIDSKIDELKMDFPTSVCNSIEEGESLYDYAELFYTKNNFGYGDTKDGIILIIDMNNMLVNVFFFGNAAQTFTTGQRDELVNKLLDDWNSDSLTTYGVLYNYYTNVFKMVEETLSVRELTGGMPEYSKETPKLPNKEDGMPYWYPDKVDNFENFHGENLPYVVDDAGIFTPEQEKILSDKVEAICKKYGISYVLFTDIDNHGLSQEVYSADFLYFNGYGIGSDYSSAVFYLSLEEGNRGWRTIATNSMEQYFTADITYEIDELVDADMRAGNYFTAFYNQVTFVENMFAKKAVLPDWYPADTNIFTLDRTGRKFSNRLDPDKPRIVDNAGLFSEEQLDIYTKYFRELSEKYDCDIIVFTDKDYPGGSDSLYTEDFYYYHGYYENGIILYIMSPNEHLYEWGVLTFGSCDKYASLPIAQRLSNEITKNRNYGILPEYCKNIEFMLKHGRLPIAPERIGKMVRLGLIVGLIVAFIVSSVLKSKMKVNTFYDAKNYVNTDLTFINEAKSQYLYTTTSKTLRAESSSGSSRSSGGGSSHSSGHSSGGGHYSGGGRNF